MHSLCISRAIVLCVFLKNWIKSENFYLPRRTTFFLSLWLSISRVSIAYKFHTEFVWNVWNSISKIFFYVSSFWQIKAKIFVTIEINFLRALEITIYINSKKAKIEIRYWKKLEIHEKSSAIDWDIPKSRFSLVTHICHHTCLLIVMHHLTPLSSSSSLFHFIIVHLHHLSLLLLEPIWHIERSMNLSWGDFVAVFHPLLR